MALVKHIEPLAMERNSVHGDVSATYSVFSDSTGNKYLQIDTYGSAERKLKDKKSQSLQLGPEAIPELKRILQEHFGRES